MFVFDLETDLIAHGNLAPKPVCVSWTAGDQARVASVDTHPDAPGFEYWMTQVLTHSVANHNIAFDMACLCAHYPDLIPSIFAAYEDGRVEDTLLRQKLLDLREDGFLWESYSLEAVAARYDLKVEKDGGWRLGYSALRGIPVAQWPAGAVEYARRDAEVTLEIYQRQAALDAPNSAEAARADFALYLASAWGVYTDKGRTEAYLAAVVAEQDRTRKYLQKAGLVRADGSRDTKAAKAYMERLCERRGRKPKLTDKGAVSLDADACTLVGSRLLELYSQYVSATGTRAKAEDLTHGYFLPLQTRYTSIVETFRTSASKPSPPVRGWQAQNPPNARKKKSAQKDVRAGFRECLRPDGVYLIADYPSAELHSVAEVCYRQFGYSRLRELLLSGKDIHCELAALTLGLSYEEVYAGRKGVHKPSRDRGKPTNYGLWGGLGCDTFILFSRAQYGLLFTPDEFHQWRGAWRRMLPETRPFFDDINRRLAGRRHCTITHPVTGFTRAGCSYTSGANFMFQHLTAWAAKAAMWEVSRRCYSVPGSALYGYRAPLFVHDEIVLEGREDTAHDAAIELAQVMQDVYNRYTPAVPLKVEACISRYWSKEAEPVWSAGRLIPWEGK